MSCGLLSKIKHYLFIKYFKIFKSYLSDRELRTTVNQKESNNFTIKDGVPQGSVFYTTDLPTTDTTITGTFADVIVIFSRDQDPVEVTNKLQNHLDQLQTWMEKCKLKMNETKSVQVTFILRKD